MWWPLSWSPWPCVYVLLGTVDQRGYRITLACYPWNCYFWNSVLDGQNELLGDKQNVNYSITALQFTIQFCIFLNISVNSCKPHLSLPSHHPLFSTTQMSVESHLVCPAWFLLLAPGELSGANLDQSLPLMLLEKSLLHPRSSQLERQQQVLEIFEETNKFIFLSWKRSECWFPHQVRCQGTSDFRYVVGQSSSSFFLFFTLP